MAFLVRLFKNIKIGTNLRKKKLPSKDVKILKCLPASLSTSNLLLQSDIGSQERNIVIPLHNTQKSKSCSDVINNEDNVALCKPLSIEKVKCNILPKAIQENNQQEVNQPEVKHQEP